MTHKKKIIIIVPILFAAACALYYFFVYRKAPLDQLAPSPSRQGILPDALNRLFGIGRQPAGGPMQPTPVSADARAKQKLYRISKEPVFAPWVSQDGASVRYATRGGGAFWQSDTEGLSHDILANPPVENLVDVVWAPDGKTAILKYANDAGEARTGLFTFADKSVKELNQFMRSVAFSPSGDRIVYNYLNTQNGDNTIAVSNPDGSKFKTLYQPIFSGFALMWPREEAVLVQTSPSYASETHLFALDTRVGAITKVLPKNFFGLASLWSPDGNRALFSRVSGEGEILPSLVGTLAQTQPRDLFEFTTLAEKCAWRTNSLAVICGIPQEIPFGLKLPDDYYKGAFVSVDAIKEVNVQTFEVRTISRAEELFPNLDIQNPVVVPDNSRMVFVNRDDGYLYALRLAP